MSHFIPMLDAIKKIDHYQISMRANDSRSAFIELDKLNACLKKMKEEVETANGVLSGIELVHARYLDAVEGHHYDDQNTIVIFPTKMVGDNHVAYDPVTRKTLKVLLEDYRTNSNDIVNHSDTAYNFLGSTPPRGD